MKIKEKSRRARLGEYKEYEDLFSC